MNSIDEAILSHLNRNTIQSTIAMLQNNQLGALYDIAYDKGYGTEFRDCKDDDCSKEYFSHNKIYVSELSAKQCLKMIDFIFDQERIYPQFIDRCVYDGTFLHIMFRLRDLKVKYENR